MILFYALAWCYGFVASHGIYDHGFISWIHSIHDLGSLSVGSGIFLFRIYVLLMSWHTSMILFYCYGFIALDVFLDLRLRKLLLIHWILFRGISLFLAMSFVESLDFIALDVFLGFYPSRNLFIHWISFRWIQQNGLSWLWIHGIHCHGSYPGFIEENLF